MGKISGADGDGVVNVQLTMSVNLTLPDGSASMDGTGGRGWVLPDGSTIKIWAVTELNDEEDLTFGEALEMGIDVEDMVTEVEIMP
jgi:hypothetical protein